MKEAYLLPRPLFILYLRISHKRFLRKFKFVFYFSHLLFMISPGKFFLFCIIRFEICTAISVRGRDRRVIAPFITAALKGEKGEGDSSLKRRSVAEDSIAFP